MLRPFSPALIFCISMLAAGCVRYLSDVRAGDAGRDGGVDVFGVPPDGVGLDLAVDAIFSDGARDGHSDSFDGGLLPDGFGDISAPPPDAAPLTAAALWVDGADVQGVFNTASIPGGRSYSAVFGTDALWLYGGKGFDTTGANVTLADLWRYDLTGGWAHVSGPLTGALKGDWGQRGQEAASNTPGSRNSAQYGADAGGQLWLYGGIGVDVNDASGQLADLWRYSPQTAQWTWVAGRNLVGLAPSFGTKGTPDASSEPGQRIDGALWIDGRGHVWLFGGKEPGTFSWRNDLWSYDPAGDIWTWHGGYNDAASYGTAGVEAPSNWPGRRFSFGHDRAPDDSFWLFGGEGRGETSEWVLADLWRLRPSSGQWTFISGAKSVGTRGVYVSLGSPDPLAMPGGRTSTRLAVDDAGDVWLFGGYGPIGVGDHSLNDLWRYQPATGLWTWVGGSDVGDLPGLYQGTAPWPGARDGHGLVAAGGQVLLFGGAGRDGLDAPGSLNDLWRLAH